MSETKLGVKYATYEVLVTPRFEGLTPKYDALIYRMIPAGVCGPFSEEATFGSLVEVDAWLENNEFARVGDYGDVCPNGFASAKVVLVP